MAVDAPQVTEAVAALEATHDVVHTRTPDETARHLAAERQRLEDEQRPAHPSSAPASSAPPPSSAPASSSTAAAPTVESAAGGAAGGAPKRKRKQSSAAERRAATGEPQRPAGHAAKAPVRPADVKRDNKWPAWRSCNFAILVAIDRDSRLNPSAGDGGAAAYTQPKLMALAASREYGEPLSEHDMFDERSKATGPFGYDGWSNVHKGLLAVEPPWRPLLRKYSDKHAAGGQSRQRFALTEAGQALAARLHAEAEAAGLCSCGKVTRARLFPAPPEAGEKKKASDPKWALPPGLRHERLPTLRAIIEPTQEGKRRPAYEEAGE